MKTYEEIVKGEEKLILRDRLAIERTILANKRTFLAYFRTAVALFGGGLALVKIIDVVSFMAIGWVFMILSPVFLVLGIISYTETKRRMMTDIDQAEEELEKTSGPA